MNPKGSDPQTAFVTLPLSAAKFDTPVFDGKLPV